jgi:hypothetical protein
MLMVSLSAAAVAVMDCKTEFNSLPLREVSRFPAALPEPAKYFGTELRND